MSSCKEWHRLDVVFGTLPDSPLHHDNRCRQCDSRTCDSGEDCVAHEDNVPYQDDDQRLGGFDNPYDVED